MRGMKRSRVARLIVNCCSHSRMKSRLFGRGDSGSAGCSGIGASGISGSFNIGDSVKGFSVGTGGAGGATGIVGFPFGSTLKPKFSLTGSFGAGNVSLAAGDRSHSENVS